MINKKLIQNIKRERKLKGLTQTKMALDLGVHKQTYASWERGLANPPNFQVMKMADIFNTQFSYLLGVENWKKKGHPNNTGGQ